MAYRVLFTSAAARQLRRLTPLERTRISTKINALSLEPRPSGVKKLQGVEELYRIRVGDYRVIYQIKDVGLIVSIVKIGNRREVYR